MNEGYRLEDERHEGEAETLPNLLNKQKILQDMRADCLMEVSRLKRSLEGTADDEEIKRINSQITFTKETLGRIEFDLNEIVAKIAAIESKTEK